MLKVYSFKNHNKNRYYKLNIQPDMLSQYVIVCEWGSALTRRGNIKKYAFNAKEELIMFLNYLIMIREKRGYQLISSS